MNLLQSLINKKYKSKWGCFSIGLLVIAPQLTFAGYDLILTYPGNLIYEGPADKIKVGDPIGTTWIATGSGMMCDRRPEKDISHAYITPISTPTGMTTTLDGIQYVVFGIGAPGIGWIMSVKDTNANKFTPLLNNENQWYPSPGTMNDERQTIGGNIKITFIKTENRLVTGTTVIPAQSVAKIVCRNNQGREVDSAFIKTPSRQIKITARACTVGTPKNDTIQMGNFNPINFTTVGSLAGNKTYNITLNCDPNIELYGTISDQSSLSNRTENVLLSSDSTASGVAVQVSYNNKVLSLGPDASSSGQINQFDITNTKDGGIINIPLTFNYIRTGTLRAGSANALVGVTFSYQ